MDPVIPIALVFNLIITAILVQASAQTLPNEGLSFRKVSYAVTVFVTFTVVEYIGVWLLVFAILLRSRS